MKVNPYVFFISGAVILLFVLLGALFSGPVGLVFTALQDTIVSSFGWLYVAAVAFFLLFVLYLLLSRYGEIRLGKDGERPEYSYFTWFSMLFSAGMGIGLLFYSVAEPILHFGLPPRAEPQSIAAARDAITITFFHWGLHAWAIYIVVGLALAYFAYRHDLPLTIRSTLYPLLGQRIYGGLGNAVDILAVFGTLFGLATSLGLGVLQINAGLDHLGLVAVSTTNQVVLITVITLAATVSVVSGVNVGIRRLSELNLGLALLLLLFVFLAGPTVFLLSSFVQSLGRYASSLVEMTFRTDAFIGLSWQKSWTMFYWGWWISWAPFVGMFIARVSRGRTIREFVAGVLLVPTLLTFFWMVVFGQTAIHLELFGPGGMVAAVQENLPTAIFVLLEKLPLAGVTPVLATLVVALFFVTSSDSGSLVVDILTSGGHPHPPVAQRVFWALMEGAVAAILLVSGGLVALQTAAITTALPFSLVMVLICWSLLKSLRAEPLLQPASWRRPAAQGRTWRQQLEQILHQGQEPRPEFGSGTTQADLQQLIVDTVLPAYRQLQQVLQTHGRRVTIEHDDRSATLAVWLGERPEFTLCNRGWLHGKHLLLRAEVQGASASGQAGGEAQPCGTPLAEVTRERILWDFIEAYEQRRARVA